MDKVTITIELERNVNGTMSRKVNMVGEGIRFFEVVGLLQLTCYEYAQQSLETSKQLPTDRETRMIYSDSAGEKKI